MSEDAGRQVPGLRIGQVAARAGVRVDTVRFYERRGLLPRAPRRASGYRAFTAATVERIRFAKQAQSLGLTLDEIAEILRSIDAGGASCAGARSPLERGLARLDERLAELRALRRRLAAAVRRCDAGACTLIEDASRRLRSTARG